MAKLHHQDRRKKTGKQTSSVWTRVIRFGVATLVLLIVFAVILWWVVTSLPRIALAQIGRLTNTQISAKSVRSELNGSVFVEALAIRPTWPQLYDDAILKAKHVYARFSPASVLLLQPKLTELRISDFVVDAQYDLDWGRWNVAAFKLNIPRRGSGGMPAVRFERGAVQYSKVSGGRPEVAMSVPIDANFALNEEGHEGYGFQLRTAGISSGFGKSSLSGFWKPGRITVTGGISSKDIPSLERAWAIDVLAGQLTYESDRSYELVLRLKDFHTTRGTGADSFTLKKPAFLQQSNPLAAVQKFVGRYRPAGTVDIELTASGNLDKLAESKVAGTVNCKDLSICDVRFPYSIEHLKGQVDFSENDFVISTLAGKHGDVNIVIDGWDRGFATERRYLYRVSSDNMTLDDELYSALRPGQKKLWSAFSPKGAVSVNYRFGRTSPQDRQETLAVELRGVNAAYKNFPYPLENLTGSIFFDSDAIVITDVASQKGDCKITISGKIAGWAGEQPIHYVWINAANVPLDRTFGAALSDRHRQLYDQVEPNGLADIRAWVFTPDANTGGYSFHADVTARRASLKLGNPPILVTDANAQAVVTSQSLEIRNFTGRHGQGTVSLSGAMQFGDPNRTPQSHWKMHAKQILLSDSLLAWLPQSLEKTVSAFRPQGNIDLNVDLNRPESAKEPDYRITVSCRDVSINHARFPYPLKNITGQIAISKDSIAIEQLCATLPDSNAEPNKTATISVTGRATLAEGALVGGTFEVDATDALLSDELASALPKSLSAYYKTLAPKGRFDLTLRTLKVARSSDGKTLVDFAGSVHPKPCSLNAAGTRAELSGPLNISGAYDTARGLTGSRLDLTGSSVTIKGKTVTSLQGALLYDPQLKKWRAENFTGRCYGGKVLGSLEIAELAGGGSDYLLRVSFDGVDLQQFLLAGRTGESPEKSPTAGRMNAALSIRGQAGQGPSQIGLCRVHITDMKVGRVSPLAKLLSVLRLTEPRDYTFERMRIDSYISRDRLLIRQFDMSGASVAFNGSGSMHLPSENVNLTLTARGRRLAAAEPSVLQALTEGLGTAVVRLEITGNYHDPQVATKALPVIEDSLRILGTPK